MTSSEQTPEVVPLPQRYGDAVKDSRRSGGVGRIAGGVAEIRRRVAAAYRVAASSDSLWSHQAEAIEAVAAHLVDESQDPRAYVVIPTAGGKTSIFPVWWRRWPTAAVRKLRTPSFWCRR